MSFMTWENEADTEDSLVAVNVIYGCPYVAENGYRMDQWDALVASLDVTQWGFYKPEERLGETMDDLMPALIPGFTEHDQIPGDFVEGGGVRSS